MRFFNRKSKSESVFSYETFALDGRFTDDANIELADAFVALLCFMANVPVMLPEKLMTTTEPGNCALVVVSAWDPPIKVFLCGCDASEFLCNLQITRAGLRPVWTPMVRPGYWSFQDYNDWVHSSNIMIQESLKRLDS